jgi:anaerobic magnesium-protoporphyrin IX monomethyl ester cyclase
VPHLGHVLLVNPTITSRRSARFPLAALNLSAALDGRYASSILDGNVDRDFVSTALAQIASGSVDAVGVSVMGGPQLRTAIALSQAVRARFPQIPIIWGGHFPTICAAACLAEAFVDYAIRGQGEETFIELLDALFERRLDALPNIAGLSWRAGAQIIHNRNRPFSAAGLVRELPFERLGNPRRYLGRTYLGQRTAGYQAALGCRFRCTFCGVAAMFRGRTALPPAQRLHRDLRYLRDDLGADSVQFYDHNFFDRYSRYSPTFNCPGGASRAPMRC